MDSKGHFFFVKSFARLSACNRQHQTQRSPIHHSMVGSTILNQPPRHPLSCKAKTPCCPPDAPSKHRPVVVHDVSTDAFTKAFTKGPGPAVTLPHGSHMYHGSTLTQLSGTIPWRAERTPPPLAKRWLRSRRACERRAFSLDSSVYPCERGNPRPASFEGRVLEESHRVMTLYNTKSKPAVCPQPTKTENQTR